MTKRLEILREVRGEVFGDTVTEIFLLGVFTHVGEGQHDDGGLVGQRQRRRLRLLSAGLGIGCW